MEGEVGRFRRTWLVPVPEVKTFDELNANMAECEARDDDRRITGRLSTVGQDWAVEMSLLNALPEERFEPGLTLRPVVDRSALVTIKQAKYSVPASLIGRQVRAVLRASEVLVSPAARRSPDTSALASEMASPCSWITTWRS